MIRSVGVVGLGYVGLTLTAALADRGATVYGAESSPEVRAMLSSGRPHLYEPGIGEILPTKDGRASGDEVATEVGVAGSRRPEAAGWWDFGCGSALHARVNATVTTTAIAIRGTAPSH